MANASAVLEQQRSHGVAGEVPAPLLPQPGSTHAMMLSLGKLDGSERLTAARLVLTDGKDTGHPRQAPRAPCEHSESKGCSIPSM